MEPYICIGLMVTIDDDCNCIGYLGKYDDLNESSPIGSWVSYQNALFETREFKQFVQIYEYIADATPVFSAENRKTEKIGLE